MKIFKERGCWDLLLRSELAEQFVARELYYGRHCQIKLNFITQQSDDKQFWIARKTNAQITSS